MATESRVASRIQPPLDRGRDAVAGDAGGEGGAGEQAKLLQEVFATTLDVIHERYFHGDHAAVPARAMEDVFHQLQRRRFAGLTLRIALDPSKAPSESR
jgi:hypothetical protein